MIRESGPSLLALTDRPKGSSLVSLESLPNSETVLVGGSLESARVEGLVVEVDIMEVSEAAVGILNM
jgi:hypothetical protein